LLVFAVVGLAFSLYLATIEKDILGVWCIYCVISLGIIGVMFVVDLSTVIAGAMRKPKAA
jgi:vitamin-K-epoxide reductase (warfarin-sensitive)